MAFNYTVELNMIGPRNLSQIAENIRSRLSNIDASVVVKMIGANEATAQIKGFTTNLANVQQAALSAGNSSRLAAVHFRTAGNSLVRFADQAALAARRFGAFTIAAGTIFTIGNAIRKGVADAISFERELIRLQQVGNGTRTEIQGISKEITRLATTFGASSKDIVNVSVVLRQAGLSAEDTRLALEGLAKSTLAPTFNDIKNTTEGLVAAFSQFNIQARDTERVLGIINQVSADLAVEAEDITSAIRRAGGQFAELSDKTRDPVENLKEFVAIFSSVRATTRESADAIATGLRTIFARLQRNETETALRNLGISLRFTRDEALALGNADLTGQFVRIGEAVERLSEGLRNIPKTSQTFADIVEQLGGYRQISRVLPLISDEGTAQRRRAQISAALGGGSLDRSAETALQAISVRASQVFEQFQKLFRLIVDNQGFQLFVRQLLNLADVLSRVLQVAVPLTPLLLTLGTIKLFGNLNTIIPTFVNRFVNAQTASGVTGANRGGLIKMQGGGVVPGSGSGDIVPALLEPGEQVIPKSIVQKYQEGRLVKLPSGAHASREELLRSFMDFFQRNEGSYREPGGGLGYPFARRQLKSVLTSGAIRYIPKGSQFFGSGIVGQAFKTDFGDIIRAQSGIGLSRASEILTGGITDGGAFSPLSQATDVVFGKNPRLNTGLNDLLKSYRPNIEGLLQATDVLDIGSGKSAVNLQRLPLVERLGQVSYFQKEELRKILKQQGYILQDAHPGNLGFLGGRPLVIDPGSVVRDPSLVPTFRKRFQGGGIGNFASGGIVPGVGNTDSVPMDLPVGSYVLRKSATESLGINRFNNGGKVPALLTPGEYVFPPDQVNRIGVSNLDRMNRAGYANGGRIGMIEGGDPEIARLEAELARLRSARQTVATKVIIRRTEEELEDLRGAILPPDLGRYQRRQARLAQVPIPLYERSTSQYGSTQYPPGYFDPPNVYPTHGPFPLPAGYFPAPNRAYVGPDHGRPPGSEQYIQPARPISREFRIPYGNIRDRQRADFQPLFSTYGGSPGGELKGSTGPIAVDINKYSKDLTLGFDGIAKNSTKLGRVLDNLSSAGNTFLGGLNKLGGFLRGNALPIAVVASQFLPQLTAGLGGDAQTAVRTGSTGSFSALRGIGGAVQGGGFGAFGASLLKFGPLGIGIAAVGGALIGLVESINQASREIAEARLARTVTRITSTFVLISEELSRTGRIDPARTADVRSDLNTALLESFRASRSSIPYLLNTRESGFGFTSGTTLENAREFQRLQREAGPEGTGSRGAAFTTEYNRRLVEIFGSESGSRLLGDFARAELRSGTDITSEDLLNRVVREFGTEASEALIETRGGGATGRSALLLELQRFINTARTAGARETQDRLGFNFGILNQAVESVSTSLRDFGNVVDSVEGALSGREVGRVTLNRAAGFLDPEFGASISRLGTRFGAPANQFTEFGGVLTTALRELPGILQASLASSERGAFVSDALRRRFGLGETDPGSLVQRAIIEGISARAGEATITRDTDVTAASTAIIRTLEADTGFAQLRERLQSLEEQRINTLIEGLNRYNALLIQSAETQVRLNNAQFQRTQTQARFRAENLGLTAQSSLLFFSSSQAQASVRANQQALLSGTRLGRASDATPEQVGAALRTTLQRIGLVTAIPEDIRTDNQRRQLSSLTTAAGQFRRVLELMSDATARNADLQERLNRVQQSRESRLQFNTRYFTGGAEQRFQLEQGFQLARGAAQRQFRLIDLPEEQRGQLVNFLQGAGQTRLGFAGGQTADELLRRLVSESGAFAGLITDQTEETEARSLQTQIVDNMRSAETALTELRTTLTDTAQTSLNRLNETLAGLAPELDRIFTSFSTSIREALERSRVAETTPARLGEIARAAGSILGGAGSFNRGGPVYANQGLFTPRGTDTVPAMLTPGEFVVNARSTQRYRSLLESINGGGGSGRYLADGGTADFLRRRLSSSSSSRVAYPLTRTISGVIGGVIPPTLTEDIYSNFLANFRRSLSSRSIADRSDPFILYTLAQAYASSNPEYSDIFPYLQADFLFRGGSFVPTSEDFLGRFAGGSRGGGSTIGLTGITGLGRRIGDGRSVARSRSGGTLASDPSIFARARGVSAGPSRGSPTNLFDSGGSATTSIDFNGILRELGINRSNAGQNIFTLLDSYSRGITQANSALRNDPFDTSGRNTHYTRAVELLRGRIGILQRVIRSAAVNPGSPAAAFVSAQQAFGDAGINENAGQRQQRMNRAIAAAQQSRYEAGTANIRSQQLFANITGNELTGTRGFLDEEQTSNILGGLRENLTRIRRPSSITLPSVANANSLEELFRNTRFSLRGYNNGGLVDSVPAMLTPGEFVMNRAATQNIGVGNLQYLQNGGEVRNVVGQGLQKQEPNIIRGEGNNDLTRSLEVFSQSSNQLATAMNLFNSNSNRLAEAMESFPQTIQLEARHTVEVVHNGAEILARLNPEIEEMIVAKTKQEMEKVFKDKFPDLLR